MVPPSKLALVGPTASGKSEASVLLAPGLGAEIVSVDSMLVYKGMDVGTAKPSPAARAAIPHHLLDVVEPSEPFSVARFQALGRAVLEDLARRGVRPLLAGGSGLYLRAMVDDLEFPGTDAATRAELEAEASAVGAATLYGRLAALDPVAAGRIDPANARRTIRALEVPAITGRRFSAFSEAWDRYPQERMRAAGIEIVPDVLAVRIRDRVGAMLARGWLEEVRRLLERGFGDWLTSTQAIGYAELARHLQGRTSLEDAVEQTVKRTRHLARRQMAWFRRDPRIRWFPAGPEGALGPLEELRRYLGAGA
jgi:tRNA dimethylallyltransferase